MKLIGSKRIQSLLCLVILVIVVGYVLMKIKYSCEIPVYQVYSCLKIFIQENHRMPVSQAELMEKDYLRVETQDNKKYYSVRCDVIEIVTRLPSKNETIVGSWVPAPFMKFFIRYGIQKDDLIERDHGLYDDATGEKVLLFTGPKSFLLSSTYNNLSVALYKELIGPEKETGSEARNGVQEPPPSPSSFHEKTD
jgi:hypothetical protein